MPEEFANPPIQVSLKGQPTSHNYVLVPRHKPELAKNIRKVTWQAVTKQLHITILETPDLDVFAWMEYLRNRRKEIETGPFVDMNEDALILKIFDGDHRELGRLRFRNFSLEKHLCCFNSECVGGLQHRIAIHYEDVDKLPFEVEETVNAQKEVDKEWQTLKV